MSNKVSKDYPQIRKRTKSREYAIQMMYCAEITEETPEIVLKNFWDIFEEDNLSIREFAEELFCKSYSSSESNDDIIKQFIAKNWTFDRISITEKCIMRVALSELFDGDAPVYAILDDYVTLSKDFNDSKSASFVNGILESIRTKFSIERGNGSRK